MPDWSPAELADAVARAWGVYTRRLSPGRQRSLTTLAGDVLVQATVADLRAARSPTGWRRTTFTRHGLREAVQAHPACPVPRLLGSSFNTTPEEVAGLLGKFSVEDTVAGKRGMLRFLGPTRRARGGAGAKEELYLVPEWTPTTSGGLATDWPGEGTPGVAALPPVDRYQAIWAAAPNRATALREAQALFHDLNVLKLVLLSLQITIEIDPRGAATIIHDVAAANVGREPIVAESHELWFDAPQPIELPLIVSARDHRPVYVDRARAFPNFQQVLVRFGRPVRPLGTVRYRLRYATRDEFTVHPYWDLKIRRCINRLRLVVNDRRPDRIVAAKVRTETAAGSVEVQDAALPIRPGRPGSRLTWTKTFPAVDHLYRISWRRV